MKKEVSMEKDEGSKGDLWKLEGDMRRQRATRDGLDKQVAQIKAAVKGLEGQLEEVQAEDCNWKNRYLEQKGINKQLDQEVAQLERDLEQFKPKQAAGKQTTGEQSEVYLRHMLRQLSREKDKLERELRDYEWRLDHEALTINQAQQEKVAMTTEISEVTLALEKHRKQCESQKATTGGPE